MIAPPCPSASASTPLRLPPRAAERSSPRRAVGLSLVELLIAATLGLMLSGGVVAVFLSNQRSADFNEALADMQESARFALNAIARGARLAGFQGCVHIDGVALRTADIVANDPPTDDLAATAVRGFAVGAAGAWTPAAPNGFDSVAADAVVGSHALALQYGGPAIARLAGPQATAAGIPSPIAPLPVAVDADSSFALETGDLALVSDCTNVELFRVSGTSVAGGVMGVEHGATHNSSGAFDRPFGLTAEMREETRIMPFNAYVYYVAPNGRRNATGDPGRSLYRQSLPFDDPVDNPPLELVDGIETMRLTFGVRDGAGALRFVLPDDPLYDPRQITVMRIGLLMRSREQFGDTDDRTGYLLAGQPVSAAVGGDPDVRGQPDESWIRLAFNTTVKIRNRR